MSLVDPVIVAQSPEAKDLFALLESFLKFATVLVLVRSKWKTGVMDDLFEDVLEMVLLTIELDAGCLEGFDSPAKGLEVRSN